MRSALSAAACCLPLLVASANAFAQDPDAAFLLIWEGTDNTGPVTPEELGVGTNALLADPGDTITLGIYADLGAAGVRAWGISLEFDASGGDVLDLVGTEELGHQATMDCTPFPVCYTAFGPELIPLTPGVYQTVDSDRGSAGYVLNYEAGPPTATDLGPSLQRVKIGTATFVVNDAIADNAIIDTGFYAGELDGIILNDNTVIGSAEIGGPTGPDPLGRVTFGSAMVTVMPEASAGLLAAAAVGALAALRHVRRRERRDPPGVEKVAKMRRNRRPQQ